MKLFNNEFGSREKAIKLLKKQIESGHFDKDKVLTQMFMWSSCLQQELNLFQKYTALLEQITQAQEEE